MATTMSTSTVAECKRVVLSISNKVEVIKMLDHGSSSTVITTKYGITKSIISEIFKNMEKILVFKQEMLSMGMGHKVKTMHLGDDKQPDKAVYHPNYRTNGL